MPTCPAVLLLICAFALAACGGAEEKDGEAEAAIEGAIVKLAKSDDPADCRKLVTRGFLEQTGKVGYELALLICEEAAVDPLVEDAEKVTVSGIEVEGDSATAVAAFVGSGFDGQTVEFGLVERDGQWKHDELLGFVKFNPEKMVTELGREMLLSAESPAEVEAATCVLGRLQKMGAEDLESLLVDEDPDPLRRLGQSCASRSSAL